MHKMLLHTALHFYLFLFSLHQASSSHSPLRDVRTQQFYSKTESVQGNAAYGVTKLIMQQPHKNIQTDVLSANTSPVMIVNTDSLHRSTSFYKEESSASKLLVVMFLAIREIKKGKLRALLCAYTLYIKYTMTLPRHTVTMPS